MLKNTKNIRSTSSLSQSYRATIVDRDRCQKHDSRPNKYHDSRFTIDVQKPFRTVIHDLRFVLRFTIDDRRCCSRFAIHDRFTLRSTIHDRCLYDSWSVSLLRFTIDVFTIYDRRLYDSRSMKVLQTIVLWPTNETCWTISCSTLHIELRSQKA